MSRNNSKRLLLYKSSYKNEKLRKFTVSTSELKQMKISRIHSEIQTKNLTTFKGLSCYDNKTNIVTFCTCSDQKPFLPAANICRPAERSNNIGMERSPTNKMSSYVPVYVNDIEHGSLTHNKDKFHTNSNRINDKFRVPGCQKLQMTA